MMIDGAAPIGIIAGGGKLPRLLAEKLQQEGRAYHIIALKDFAEITEISHLHHDWVRIGAFGQIVSLLRAKKIRDLVFVGPVKRPSLAALFPDREGLKILGKLGLNRHGDDGLLRRLIHILEQDYGFSIHAYHSLMPHLIPQSCGVFSSRKPDALQLADIEKGLDCLALLSAADIGQSLIIQQGIVLAVEAAEGTDQMIRRTASLFLPGTPPILVKTAKDNQEERADFPTIGPQTVKLLAQYGYAGLAFVATRTMLVDQEECQRIADQAGMVMLVLAQDRERPALDDDHGA